MPPEKEKKLTIQRLQSPKWFKIPQKETGLRVRVYVPLVSSDLQYVGCLWSEHGFSFHFRWEGAARETVLLRDSGRAKGPTSRRFSPNATCCPSRAESCRKIGPSPALVLLTAGRPAGALASKWQGPPSGVTSAFGFLFAARAKNRAWTQRSEATAKAAGVTPRQDPAPRPSSNWLRADTASPAQLWIIPYRCRPNCEAAPQVTVSSGGRKWGRESREVSRVRRVWGLPQANRKCEVLGLFGGSEERSVLGTKGIHVRIRH